MTMKQSMRILAVTLALCVARPAPAAEAMSNQDVIDMVHAGVPVHTIATAIANARPQFDTSSKELIGLHKAGVPDALIDDMLAANSSQGAAGSRSDTRPAGGPNGNGATSAHLSGYNPEEVVIVASDGRHTMKYLIPTIRTAARAFGYGGVGAYATLNGPRAQERITDPSPGFLVLVPENAQPQAYATLVHMAVRRNGTRDVMIGGGYMSYSTGIHPDRVIAVTSASEPDQSSAPKGYVLYRLTPTSPLQAGEEYAVVFYNTQFHHIGFFTGFGDSYFDFGVDGH
jgi:hypothetical protein